MTRNSRAADDRTKRREHVAHLRLRGLSQREIVVMLAKIVDNEGNPAPIVVDVAQVNRDLKLLRAEWRANAAEDIADRKSKQLAEIAEGKRRAWTDGNLSALVQMWKLEADIFGTNAPTKVEVNDLRDKPDSDLVREFNTIVHSAAAEAGDSDTD